LFDENSTGICSEVDYPYAGHRRWIRGCAIEKGFCTGVEHTRVASFVDVENTVQGLMEALAEQPVSVAIEADQQSFQFYKSVSGSGTTARSVVIEWRFCMTRWLTLFFVSSGCVLGRCLRQFLGPRSFVGWIRHGRWSRLLSCTQLVGRHLG
jgi:hypothetical protein